MVGVHLLVGIALKLGRELIALLVTEGKSAVDCRVPIAWMALRSEEALLQRRVLCKWRRRGLSMVRPDIALAEVLEGTIQAALAVRAGQLGVDIAAVEEVRVGVAALGTRILVKGAERLVPRVAGKAARVPAPNAVTMALIHGEAPECEKGDLDVVNKR
jgi:hypothetical protein